ncbi:MAG: cytochrome c oxidase assembly protein [Bryobacterales bacterium]
MTTWEFWTTAWHWTPLSVSTLTVGLAAVAWAVWRQRDKHPAKAYWLGAYLLLILAAASPLATLSAGVLYSAHMAQHIILLLLVPLLATLALHASSGTDEPPHPRLWLAAAGWISGVGAMWFWHEPSLCSLSVVSPGAQTGQMISLLLAGYIFWRPVWGPASQRLDPAATVAYLFSACVACTALGIYITFVPVTACPVFVHAPADSAALQLVRGGWGLSAGADQQLGGLLMWVPTCLIYLASILAQFGRGYNPVPLEGAGAHPSK